MKRYRNKKWLKRQYKDKEKSSDEIAEMESCDGQTILNWLHKFDIPTYKAHRRPQGIEKECPICGDKFYVRPSNSDQKTCSNECMAKMMQGQKRPEIMGENNPKYKREEVICDYCGKTFKRAPSFNKGEHLFCSPACRKRWETEDRDYSKENHPQWKGGHNEYIRKRYEAGGKWKENRIRALQRDDNKCQFCGTENNLDIHHIKPVRTGGSNYRGNLVTLCRSCHAKVENGS